MIPDSTGGAGIGNFKNANNNPTAPPANKESTTSFISYLYTQHINHPDSGSGDANAFQEPKTSTPQHGCGVVQPGFPGSGFVDRLILPKPGTGD
jgi:hypothetical protein